MSSPGEATGAPTREEAAHAVYAGIHEQPVRLSGGRWEGEPFVPEGASRPSVTLVEELFLTGDLDADGRPESAVLLNESSGGSGTHLYLAILGRQAGKPTNLATVWIGDRVQARSMRVEEGQIALDVVQHAPEDASCCPTQIATRIWRLQAGALEEGPSQQTGQLSIAVLENTEWVLKQIGWSDRQTVDVEVRLKVEGSRLTGTSGCNQYFATITESSPGVVKISELGATRRSCPPVIMDLESRFLGALQAVRGYQFLAGQLLLNSRSSGTLDVLVFVPGGSSLDPDTEDARTPEQLR